MTEYKPTLFGVGYIGKGEYKSRDSATRKNTPHYRTWKSMLRRCYSEEVNGNYKAYEGCIVDEDWHNFQNFASWADEQEFFKCGYELDKDLLSKGGKMYSKDTCTFLPKELNRILQGTRSKNNSSVGKRGSRYRSVISIDGKNVSLGTFDTREEAYSEYCIKKKEYIVNKAIEWKGRISEEAFKALLNWEVY